MGAFGAGVQEHTQPIKNASFFGALARRRRDPLIIVPYIGYGTAERLRVCGRVLQDEGFRPAADRDGRLRNLVAFFKRLESDEVPGAQLRARFRNVEQQAVSDREGYFSLDLAPKSLGPGLWQQVELALVSDPSVKSVAKVLVPPANAQFGVISDIDDTVVYSNVTHKVRMVLALALSNARTRKPFKGVTALYQALHRGRNPLFYVSKSPWNLYLPLLEFFEHQGLPLGPLVLRDFGLRMKKDHKTQAIADILEMYPRLQFVLIGDSGEQDPEIYSAIVRRFPDRIRTIYIRSVVTTKARIAKIQKLIQEVAPTGCQLVLAPDSEFAAVHAAAEGLIAPAALPHVRAQKQADERAPRIPPARAAR